MNKPRRIVQGQRVSKQKLARAKALRREMTPQEAKLWHALRTNQLLELHFRRQQIVDGFILDFYCHRAGLVVEIDGPVHLRQADYDAARSRWLAARSLRVLRITNEDIDADLEAVLARVAAVCREQLSTD